MSMTATSFRTTLWTKFSPSQSRSAPGTPSPPPAGTRELGGEVRYSCDSACAAAITSSDLTANTLCINNERYSCNTNGTRSCNEGFFNLPECLTQCAPTEHSLCDLTGNVVCREDYFTEDCSVFCRASQSEETGFYSCDPLTGEKVCLKWVH